MVHTWMVMNLNGEESVTKSSRNVSGKKITHGTKILPKLKKQRKNITIYVYTIPESCLSMHLIFVSLQQGR